MALSAAAPGARFHAGKAEQYVLNQFRIFSTALGSIGVVRTVNGFFAVMNRCPHMSAPICAGREVTNSTLTSDPFEYVVGHENAVVRCPWHRWEFRIDSGQNIGNVTRGRLLTFDVKVEGSDVFVMRRNAKPNTRETSE